MSTSIYNNTCPTGRIRLPQITRGTSSGYVIDSTKFTNNEWTDPDLCYDMCNNGDVPHFDKNNGVYYCLAPAIANGATDGQCLTTDIATYKETKITDYSPVLLASTGTNASTWTPPPYIINGTANAFMCKRPMLGLPSKQTLFNSEVIATNVGQDIANGLK
jgi:hypothetical protein